MALLKPTIFKKNLFQSLAMMILLLGVNSCALFENPKYLVRGDFKDKYIRYPWEDKDAQEDFVNKISPVVAQYIKVNEVTAICDCLEGEKKEKCFEGFLDKK